MPGADIFCPLCGKRLPDTKLTYNEVIASQTKFIDNGAAWAGQSPRDLKQVVMGTPPVVYSNRVTSISGDVMVCAECAARYDRSVALRARSRLVMMWAVVALVASIVVFVSTLYPRGSLWGLLTLIPLVAAVGLFVAGLAVAVVGRQLARPLLRYLRS